MMTKTRLIIGTGLIFIAGLLVGLFVTNKRDKGRYQGITQEGGTKILDTETGIIYKVSERVMSLKLNSLEKKRDCLEILFKKSIINRM